MIKILVVEDNTEKFKRVFSLLTKECSVVESDVQRANCVHTARELLISGLYDLLLLDLVLPVNEDGNPSEEAGNNFLEEIYYNPNINTPIHVIGLTEFQKVFEEYSESFEDKLWGLINFDLRSTDWSD